jgi:hypothetical protein
MEALNLPKWTDIPMARVEQAAKNASAAANLGMCHLDMDERTQAEACLHLAKAWLARMDEWDTPEANGMYTIVMTSAAMNGVAELTRKLEG